MAWTFIGILTQWVPEEGVEYFYKQAQLRIDAYYKAREIETKGGWVGQISTLLLGILWIWHVDKRDLNSVIDYLEYYLVHHGKVLEEDIPLQVIFIRFREKLILTEIFMQFIEQVGKILDSPLEII